ncbi:hypothetical protein LJC52_02430 [Bacteroidales bacterium OttesenSCG-928-A17]|nr:hypothetical protein [Bacteroidales bacterium OttesenSCG-928-A17]
MKRIPLNVKAILFLSVFMLSVLGVRAQDPVFNPSDVVDCQVQVMKERLNLNDSQVSKVTDIIRADANRSKSLTTEEAKKVRDEREAKYKGIFSAEQFKKWLAERDSINKEAQDLYLSSEAYARDFTRYID